MFGFKAAFHGARSQHLPGHDRLSQTLEHHRAEVAVFEVPGREPPRAGGDHDRPGIGQRLQARSQIRRVADSRLTVGGTLRHDVANHHNAGGDSDASRQLLLGDRFQPRNRGDDVEGCSDSTLRVVFMRAGKAEIYQQSVAQKLGNETVIA